MNKLKQLAAHKKSILIIAVIIIICTVIPVFVFQGNAAPITTTPAEKQSFWLWDFLGRLHPLVIHFPVTLILFAALIELLTLKNFNNKFRPTLGLILYIGAASAFLSALLGLLLANIEDYGPGKVAIHQWIGIGTAIFALATAYLYFLVIKKEKLFLVKSYRGFLFFTAFAVAVAGHYGALLTHGDDYLSSALPWSKDYGNKEKGKLALATLQTTNAGAFTPDQQLQVYTEVRTIFAHNCYSCHSAEKVKGDLRLDVKKFAFRGGKSGKDILPGNPKESEIMRRLTLPRDHKEAMPSKGKKLTDDEIAMISLWIEKGAVWPDVADQKVAFRVAKLEPRMPILPLATNGLTNPVDLWVNNYFGQKKITWPQIVDDRTYLRRIYLDIIGFLPSPEELDSFSHDDRPDKRAIWVRQLLNRNDDYAINWLTFWNDELRNDYTGTGYITQGRYAITDWLYKSLRTNKPYDQFVRELISPDSSSMGFVKGIKWRGVVNSSQSTEMQAAQNVAQVFLGLNLKCASCHNSFISDWKLDEAYAFANIFSDTTMTINRCDVPTGRKASTRMLWKQLGTIDSTAKTEEKLKQLANNLTRPEDGRLYRTIVNRIWAQLMGRGIIEPVDMMDNEPWSQDLLDWMASNFVNSKYDLKELIYLITTSKTYMLPAVGMKDASKIIAKDYEFKGMLSRRMYAEQFSDVVSKLIEPIFPDSTIVYDPYKKLGLEKPVDFFARASLVANNRFLTALGRPNRETVATTRDSRANLLQALEVTNGSRFNEALKVGAENWKKKYKDDNLIIKEIYRRALNREPSNKEFDTAKKMLNQSKGTEGIQDLFWAVVLLPEFQIIN